MGRYVDEYLMGQPLQARDALAAVREAIVSALPDVEELIAYNLPAYKINGTAVVFFAGWKRHYSIYPATDALIQHFGGELANFKIVKSTIQFPYDKPVPVELIQRIARFLAEEKSGGPNR
jgi:uncharacterized protein YdhG (YjbR/CyaY superfamily)